SPAGDAPVLVAPGGGGCPPAAPPLSQKAAGALFAREAIPGVCNPGRYRSPYLVWGPGRPLLFIPGVAASGRSFILVLARLAEHFRCISYDLPMGRGDGARLGRVTHANLVAHAFALMDHLKIDQSYLFGSSFGSTIALA